MGVALRAVESSKLGARAQRRGDRGAREQATLASAAARITEVMTTTLKAPRRTRLASVGLPVPELRLDKPQKRCFQWPERTRKTAVIYRRYNCSMCGAEKSCRYLVIEKETGARICRMCLGEAVDRFVKANFTAHPQSVQQHGGPRNVSYVKRVAKSAATRAKLSAVMMGNQNARKYLDPEGRIA